MTDCLFCKIIGGQIPGQFVYQDDQLVAIKDINPQAPLHALIIPRKHIATLNDLDPADDTLVGSMNRAAAALAKEHGYAERGYRTVFNCNREAGQTVFHIHLHLLAGRGLGWPPGYLMTQNAKLKQCLRVL
jgi:histidine triad (HIT) family protein